MDFFEDTTVVDLAIERTLHLPVLAASDPAGGNLGEVPQATYRDRDGTIQHVWAERWWRKAARTDIPDPRPEAPRPAGVPAFVIVRNTLCIVYRDAGGLIQLVPCVAGGPSGTLNGDGSGAAKASSDPVAILYNGGTNVVYAAADGGLWDRWYWNGAWNTTRLSGPGITGARPGVTNAPPVSGKPSVEVIVDQLHVVYRDPNGAIQDVYLTAQGAWAFQTLNVDTPPVAIADPVVILVGRQQHVLYRCADGLIQDLWYTEPGTGSN